MRNPNMENPILLYISLALIFILFLLKLLQFSNSRTNQKLPPSPTGRLPLIGHLHLLKHPIHRTLHGLSLKYGPILSLRFGSRLVFLVSSPSIAEECFTTNDVVLANRPRLLMGKYIGYNNTTMVASPYGSHWRNLRKIGSIEIFSNHRINMFSSIRKDEVKRLLCRLGRDSRGGFTKVELKSVFTDLTLNNMMRMVAGKRYCGDGTNNEEEAMEFKEILAGVIKLGSASHPGDFLPILNWFGHSFEKKLKKMGERMDRFLQCLIDEKRNNGGGNTMIDHLLTLQQSKPEYYTDEVIKGLILVILSAGTDTISITIEWALSNLLNHRDALIKARIEIDTQVGQNRLIDESDFSNLQYLQNIIFETLRLYPPAPLLIPHMSSNHCIINGYDMPPNTILMTNAWTIHRDPEIWEEPLKFNPDRFRNDEVDAEKLIMPFGLGRRTCPGAGLAQRMVCLTLGSLIQCFEWERINEEEINMEEGKGITMSKLKPLEALCKARPIINELMEDVD
ncbi:cytochrome P450 81D11-like [Carica papaya]|uniref:cytochrome P450 81D11-like n=1 Tax=Carica papaya TaxID=3649 RepID=UPI000B8D02EA|nr:cytochrome P450 81D11-like [Carica papaya]